MHVSRVAGEKGASVAIPGNLRVVDLENGEPMGFGKANSTRSPVHDLLRLRQGRLAAGRRLAAELSDHTEAIAPHRKGEEGPLG